MSSLRASVAIAGVIATVITSFGCEDERQVQPPAPPSSNAAPVVTIVAPIDGARLTDPANVRLAGIANDPEDGPLPPMWMRWMSDVDGELGTGAELFVALSEGRHRITLLAMDTAGFNGAAQVDVIVSTSANMPPTAIIESPRDGAAFMEGSSITLSGRGVDVEDGELDAGALFWSSSLAGSLGLGNTLLFAAPAIGEHVILLTAIDSAGVQGLASVRVIVAPIGANLPPTVVIDQPATGTAFLTGEAIELGGTATDPEDGALTGGQLEWRSSVHGSLGSGETLTRGDLALGLHTITLTATDTQGAAANDSVVITVNRPGNTAPVVTISAPTPGSTFFSNQAVTFAGAATDAEDGALGGAQLQWRSNLGGVLGSGTQLVAMGLAVGSHTVTLVATDSGGSVGTAQVGLTVLAANTAPSVSITAPANGARFTAGDMIQFAGAANDAEDGALSGMALVWQSSVDGTMGSGSPLSFSSLTDGQHTITLTAVDSGGLPASASINVLIDAAQVNLPPVAQLTGPPTGGTNAVLTFDGSGSRDNDGTITSYRFDFGDGSTPISGPAAMASHTYTADGTFTVTLTVTDDDGASGEASHEIDVFIPVPVPEVVVDVPDSLGTNCDIAIDGADRPHVIYRNDTHRQLWYAAWDGAAWSTSLVDGPGFDIGGLPAGNFALAVDAAGTPHVVYAVDSQIRYATPNGSGWIREAVSSNFTLTGDRPLAVALDPANGGRPTVAWSHYNGSTVAPVVAYRAGAAAWTEQQQSTTSTRDYFLGGLAFDGAGTAWLSWDERNPGIIKWSAAGGFFDPSVARPNVTVGEYVPLVLDSAQQPIMVTAASTYHLVGGAWIDTSHHYGGGANHDAAINASGDFVVGLRHGSGLELAHPTPYWVYDYQGPMASTDFGVAVDSAGRARACFFRSGNLIVY